MGNPKELHATAGMAHYGYSAFFERIGTWGIDTAKFPSFLRPQFVKDNGNAIIYAVAGAKFLGSFTILSRSNFTFGFVCLIDFLVKATLFFHLPRFDSPASRWIEFW